MAVITDATALILLAKADLLETFAKRNEIIVPKFVYEEVVRGKEKGRQDSMLIERLAAEKRLAIEYPSNQTKNKIEKLFNLREGELEVIALASGKKHTVLTDDKKCLNAAKALNIGFITSLDVVAALHKKGAISKEKALECVDRLGEYGWYSKNLIKIYRDVIK